jgi:hypothetical protein
MNASKADTYHPPCTRRWAHCSCKIYRLMHMQLSAYCVSQLAVGALLHNPAT